MEITNIAVQTVEPNQYALFAETPIQGNCAILHRQGAGLVKMRGLTSGQCRARFKVTFNGNIAVPTGGTLEAISVAFALDGEPLQATTMTVTPAAVQEFFNVSATTYIDVPKGCCSTVGVNNINTQAILVQNANLIVERVA